MAGKIFKVNNPIIKTLLPKNVRIKFFVTKFC